MAYESRQKFDFSRRTTANSWRSSETSQLEERPVYVPMRGSVRALDGQYYNHGKKRFNRKQPFPPRSESSSETKPPKLKRTSPVIKTTVQNLNLDCVKPQRAGVILYTVVDGATYFGLGLDSRTHDLTDFAGGVMYRTDFDCIQGALREFNEETLFIFESISRSDIVQCPVLYDDRNLIIFMRIDLDPDVVSEVFNEKYKKVIETEYLKKDSPRLGIHKKCKHSEPEVCGITWLTWKEFQRSIKERGILFSRVQKFLTRADNFEHLL